MWLNSHICRKLNTIIYNFLLPTILNLHLTKHVHDYSIGYIKKECCMMFILILHILYIKWKLNAIKFQYDFYLLIMFI